MRNLFSGKDVSVDVGEGMETFEKRVLATIRRFRMFPPVKRSWWRLRWVDSMVLLTVLMRLPLQLTLAVFHLNHELRRRPRRTRRWSPVTPPPRSPCYLARPACDLLTVKGHNSFKLRPVRNATVCWPSPPTSMVSGRLPWAITRMIRWKRF